MDYAGPGCQPWLEPSSISLLKRAQNKALSRTPGQYITSPIGFLHHETDLPTYATIINRKRGSGYPVTIPETLQSVQKFPTERRGKAVAN